MRTDRCFIALTTLVVLGGCAAEDPVDEYRDAIPSSELLSVSIPGMSSSEAGAARGALIGERAKTYELTYDVSNGINDGLRETLEVIYAVAQTPPHAVDGTHAAWVFGEPLSALDYALIVNVVGERRYEYVLTAKLRGASDDDYKALVAGVTTETDEGLSGDIVVDLDAGHALSDLEHPSTGQIAATWSVRENQRSVRALLEGDNDDGMRVPGAYTFRVDDSGAGSFEFATRSNIADGEALENVAVKTRWQGSGLGRGDMVIEGGDVAEGTLVFAHECWDRSFARSYFEVPTLALEGDAATCVYAEAEYATFEE